MKKFLSLILASMLIFAPSIALADITFVDSLGEEDTDAGSTISTTATMTTTTCTDGVPYIACAVTCEDSDTNPNVSDMDWNTTEAFTCVIKRTVVPGTNNSVEICTLANATVTTSNITATLDAACFTAGISCVALCGAKNQAAEASNGATGTGTNPSTSVTTVADGAWIVDAVNAAFSFETLTANATQTDRENFVITGSHVQSMSTEADVSPAGSTPMDWTLGSGAWSQVAVSIAPESFGTTFTPYVIEY